MNVKGLTGLNTLDSQRFRRSCRTTETGCWTRVARSDAQETFAISSIGRRAK
jgi:hypothetical protein